MPILQTTRNYDDGEVYTKTDVDAPLDDIEQFVNVIRLNDDNIQNNGITGATKLLNQSVTEAKLATDSVSTDKIQNNAVTTNKIQNGAITTEKIADKAVTREKIAESAVGTDQIENDAVTTEKIRDKAVTAEKLSSAEDDEDDDLRAVTTDHIRNSAITRSKINDGAVTPTKQSIYYKIHTFVLSSTQLTESTDFEVSGQRPIKLTLYNGFISNSGSSGTFNIESSPDDSNWTVVYSFATAPSNVRNIYLGSPDDAPLAPSAITSTGSISVIIENLPEGTTYFRLRTTGGYTFHSAVPLKGIFEEM